MTVFQEDMIFKNIAEEDVQTLLEIFGKESETAKIWTEELRLIDPTTYKPDLILELDNQNLIIEFQSTKVDDDFSQRAHIYVAITDLKKENDKKVNLEVLSTAESSKIVRYKYSDSNEFIYKVTGLQEFDGEKTINNVEKKVLKKKKLSSKEIICFALAPFMDKENIEKNIKRVVNILIQLQRYQPSDLHLARAILWLAADKYIEDEELRILIQDLLGDKMSAVYEYGERKEQNGIKKGIEKGKKEGIKEGMENVILRLYYNGMQADKIAMNTGMDLNTIQEIINKYEGE